MTSAERARTVRLVASDLDGTLVRSDGTISDASRTALKKASEAGLLVAFVTGRPPRWLHEVADQTGHTGVAVAANGAVVYDMASETVVRAHHMSPALLTEVAADLRAAFPSVHFAVEYGQEFGCEPEYRHDWPINPRYDRSGARTAPPLVADLATVLRRPAVKLLAKDRAADPDEFAAAAFRVLAGRATVTHSSRHGLLEIAAAGVTKASGLAEIASTHGIGAAEVVAVGDMPNDVPMLKWAGRSYAVANAHPLAIAAADEMLPTNDADGVATLIESLLAEI